jgi:hypothetical protein
MLAAELWGGVRALDPFLEQIWGAATQRRIKRIQRFLKPRLDAAQQEQHNCPLTTCVFELMLLCYVCTAVLHARCGEAVAALGLSWWEALRKAPGAAAAAWLRTCQDGGGFRYLYSFTAFEIGVVSMLLRMSLYERTPRTSRAWTVTMLGLLLPSGVLTGWLHSVCLNEVGSVDRLEA